jgi:hypothetical protein
MPSEILPRSPSASRPVVVAIHKGGRWTSICLYGPDEHRSPLQFPTLEAAMADAKRIAAALLHTDIGGDSL